MPIGPTTAPCSMHIDEVEAIWAAIAEADDWAPFDAKIAAIRRMGEAMRGSALDRRTPKHGEVSASMANTRCSTEPATGAEVCGPARSATPPPRSRAARAAWPDWAAQPLAYRIETLRRFANVVRAREGRVRRPDRARDRQAALGSADRGRRGRQQGRDFGRRLCRADPAAASSKAALGDQGRGPPQAARRAGGARARTISPRTCPTATSSRR